MGADRSFSLQTLENLVGATNLQLGQHLLPTPKRRWQQALHPDWDIQAIVRPQTPMQLAAVMSASPHQRWVPYGAGSKLDWGGLVGGGKLAEQIRSNAAVGLLGVSTERLNSLIDHAVGDLTVTVEAGMRFADLQAVLAQAGQFLPIDPAYPDQATIGGIVATADTGSLRQRYNGVRDLLLGLSFVRADGQLAKAGGRVVKNVAGYDLMKLFTGSYGTLGVITQVTLRVYPLPEVSATLVLAGEATAIAQAAQTILNSALTPTSLDLLSASGLRGLAIGAGMGLVIRLQGMAASVAQQRDRLAELGQALNLSCHDYTADADAQLWQRLPAHMTAVNRETGVVCKLGVKPAETVHLLQEVDTLLPEALVQLHLASGLGRLTLAASPPPDTLLKLRLLCQATGGFLSILQAPVPLKQAIEVWGYAGNALPWMQKLKQQFDPRHQLSPNRFVGSI